MCRGQCKAPDDQMSQGTSQLRGSRFTDYYTARCSAWRNGRSPIFTTTEAEFHRTVALPYCSRHLPQPSRAMSCTLTLCLDCRVLAFFELQWFCRRIRPMTESLLMDVVVSQIRSNVSIARPLSIAEKTCTGVLPPQLAHCNGSTHGSRASGRSAASRTSSCSSLCR